MPLQPNLRSVVMLCLVALSGCGHSGGSTIPDVGSTLPILSVGGLSGNLTLSVGTVIPVTVSEETYAGPFTAVSSDTAVLSVAPASAQSTIQGHRRSTQELGTATFTVTGIGPGSATLSFSDAFDHTVSVPVTVTSNGAVHLSATSLSFTQAGATNAQTVTATEAAYTGAFTATSTTCSGIASISPANGTSFTVTPISAGLCSYAIADANGQTATLTISVTITNVGGS